jgi:hypothetical protein
VKEETPGEAILAGIGFIAFIIIIVVLMFAIAEVLP